MAKLNLVNSGVLFNEELHEYTMTLPSGETKKLSGITRMLSRQLFPDEYSNVPEHLIRKMAEYGTGVHKSIQNLVENFEHDGTVEVEDFVRLTKENNLITECSEYNVSDLSDWSSNIDVVFRNSDTHFTLGDIKSSRLTPVALAKARWQLSIYAYLFELQNKKAKVDSLCILNIRNKMKKDGSFDHICKLIPVERIPSDICKELLDADLRGEQFKNPFDIPDEISSQLSRIISLIETKKQAEEELNSLKQNLLDTMQLLDVKTWVTPDIRITKKAESVRTSFDLNAFKKGHPEIDDYDSYMKTSNIASSLLIAV